MWTPKEGEIWSLTRASIEADEAHGKEFLSFLDFWLDAAEKLMAEQNSRSEAQGIPQTSPANALRKACELAEQTIGFQDLWMSAQLLACALVYWVHGDHAARELSVFELKMAAEAITAKIAVLGAGAEEAVQQR